MTETRDKTEPNTLKRRLLLMLKLLYETTDKDHQLSTHDLIEYMDSQGIYLSRKTIRPDIELLNELGCNIEIVESKPNRYYWGERRFELAELKMLIDAVSSSRFIPARKTRELTKKLTALASEPQAELLSRHIYPAYEIKPKNEKLLSTVDRINTAIDQKKKISFRYEEYNAFKRKILRNDGEVYTLSPYVLYWNDDFYYAVGWSEKHGDISSFRVDRMRDVRILDIKGEKRPKGFKIADYAQTVFEMYTGEEAEVVLQCENELMKYIVDRFGEKVKARPNTKETFTAEVTVRLSPTFYGWVFGFGGRIRILSPDKAVKEMREMARPFIEEDERR